MKMILPSTACVSSSGYPVLDDDGTAFGPRLSCAKSAQLQDLAATDAVLYDHRLVPVLEAIGLEGNLGGVPALDLTKSFSSSGLGTITNAYPPNLLRLQG